MIILAIETSCDDTCLALVKSDRKSHRVLANLVSSQVKIHAPYGGVVPTLAKREHQKNLIPLLEMALKKSKIKNQKSKRKIKNKKLEEILSREEMLLKKLKSFLKKYPPGPEIDLIAVTIGPGLEPALWPGINLAKALSYIWDKPIMGVNHIEGHIYANWLRPMDNFQFPALCLVVSGGHTQLILMRDYLKYKLLGETRDDAAGEAFDKVAKLLGLGYPGGPIIAQRAKKGRADAFDLPRPMIQSKNFDFSFSGLKTAVLYLVRDLEKNLGQTFRPVDKGRLRVSKAGLRPGPTEKQIYDLCASFQQAVIDVLIAKTLKAVQEYQVKTIMLSGGVAANQELRKQFKKKIKKHFPQSQTFIPPLKFCTDNAVMIALTAYYRLNLSQTFRPVGKGWLRASKARLRPDPPPSPISKARPITKLKAQANLRIA